MYLFYACVAFFARYIMWWIVLILVIMFYFYRTRGAAAEGFVSAAQRTALEKDPKLHEYQTFKSMKAAHPWIDSIVYEDIRLRGKF
jgi:hypothetical protein